MKTKYYLLGFICTVVLVIAYHFFAAHQAEQQIDEAIQQLVSQRLSAPSVTYSSIDVAPFKGDVYFSHVTLVDSAGMYRSRNIHLDMSYGDFLNIYVWGLKDGLEHLTRAQIVFNQPSYVHRSALSEIKLMTLRLEYEGKFWDLLAGLITSDSLNSAHRLQAHGEQLTIFTPTSFPGRVKSETFRSEHELPAGSPGLLRHGRHHLTWKNMTWTPPEPFQKQYAFFIRGFGYETDQIPADSLRLSFTTSPVGPSSLSTTLFTDLFNAVGESQLLMDWETLQRSRLRNGTIRLEDSSNQFMAFMTNLEQLLGKNIVDEQSDVILRFSGTLSEPEFIVE